MARRRLGVVLPVPPPFDAEVDGLRRALGDGGLGRIGPHLTLVPPVNVRDDRLGDVLVVLRRAAAASAPITVTLGPPATFLPDAPVVHLPAGGDDQAGVALGALRQSVFVEPLARPLTHPFVPHVTLADEAGDASIGAAVAALAGYVVEATFAVVHLLEEAPGRVWRPIADVPLGPPTVVARGPMQLELLTTTLVDPEARALLEREDPTPSRPFWWAGPAGNPAIRAPERSGPTAAGVAAPASVVVTARRVGEVVGVAEGVVDGSEGRLHRLLVSAAARGTGVGTHLLDAFGLAAAGRGCRRAVADVPATTRAAEFLRGRGWAARDAAEPGLTRLTSRLPASGQASG